MSEAVPEMVQYRPSLQDCDAVRDNEKIRPPKAIIIMNEDSGDLRWTGIVEYSNIEQDSDPSIIDLTHEAAIYIEMLEPPAILELIRTKLHTSSDVEDWSKRQKNIDFVLNNIFNIIGKKIGNPGFDYRIDTGLRDKGNTYGWERIEIAIKFPDDHYKEINGYWKHISSDVSDFYELLKSYPEFSDERVMGLRRSIYIIMFSEE